MARRLLEIPIRGVVLLLGITGTALGQVGQGSRSLGPRIGSAIGEFTEVVAVRELSDGGVLIADRELGSPLWQPPVLLAVR